jgi:hypothetical protein
MGDEIFAEHLCRARRRFVGAVNDFDATAFAAPAETAPPSSSAAALAASGVDATMPRGTATPKRLRMSFA